MKIYIWGTGTYAEKVIEENISLDTIEGFIDNNREKKEFMGKTVIQPDKLCDNDFDCVIVANIYSKDIYCQCKNMGINTDKFIFLYHNYEIADLNKDYSLAEKVLGKEYSEKIKNLSGKRHIVPRAHTFSETPAFEEKFRNDISFNTDYVRIKTFEMVAYEINKNNITGETAEVGVFRGEFAKYINYIFPDKKIYLFDTFESFGKEELQNEINNGYCDGSFEKEFKNTSISLVMNKMTYPENAIIKKGYFPDSLDGLEEKFAFVSLDVDFEKSMLECLRYFYPRLSEGGYIFIHDYNYCDELNLKGVRIAVEQYEAEIGRSLHKVPLCDQGGTLIISK